MTAFAVLLSILATIFIGAMSPGPSFVLVSRVAIASSRTHGLASALGMGLGGAIFAALAVLGLTALLMQFEWLYLILKLLGGAYLIYIGIRIWRGASEPLTTSGAGETAKAISVSRAFFLGLITQLSNPKTSIVYASIFAALMPPSPPLWLLLSAATDAVLRRSRLVRGRCLCLFRFSRAVCLYPAETVDRSRRWYGDGSARHQAHG